MVGRDVRAVWGPSQKHVWWPFFHVGAPHSFPLENEL